MSHCSKLEFKFKDKQILYKAMHNLGMNPENKIWNHYKNNFEKLIRANGTLIGKLLSGSSGKINVFFIDNEVGLTPYIESHNIKGYELEVKGSIIINQIQREYVRCSLERLQQTLLQKGQSARLYTELDANNYVYHLEMVNTGIKLIVIVDESGEVYEEASGFKGRSCIDFTEMFENLVSTEAKRQWKPEYSEVVEDRLVQVLKLD